MSFFFFFFKQKTAYEIHRWLEFRRVLFRSKKVFSGPDGEQVLQILCTEHHVLDGTYSEDPNKMYFREGERSVVKSILARIELDELAALKRLRKMIDNSLNQDDE